MCKIAVLGSLLFIFISCSSSVPKSVRETLKAAGENRAELVKVIEHYQNEGDSLKLEAAYFLLGNMIDKYSVKYEYIQPFLEFYEDERKKHKSVYDGFLEICDRHLDSIKGIYGINPSITFDIHHITADYLIKNIEQAFLIWREPWSARFDFETFCEYILPYRIHNEPLSDWREHMIDRYKSIKDSVTDQSDTEEMALYLNDLIGSLWVNRDIDLPDIDAISNDKIQIGMCHARYMEITHAFRAMGIPSMIDFTFQQGRSFLSHEWTAYLDTLYRLRPFDGGDTRRFLFTRMPPSGSFSEKAIIPLGEGFGPTVFRFTFSLQPESLASLEKSNGRNIPYFFTNRYIKNVTPAYEFAQYTGLIVDVKEYSMAEEDLVYICVFGYGDEIREADWAYVQNGQVSFNSLGTGIVYILCTFKNGVLTPFTFPFILKDEKTIEILQPNLDQPVDMILTRKCKISHQMQQFANNMVGGIFEGSETSTFESRDTLFVVEEAPEFLEEKSIESPRKYRFVRYFSPDMSINVAEIHFFTKSNKNEEIRLRGYVISDIKNGKASEDPEKLFDGDIRTHFNAEEGSWVGIDLKEAQRITKIEYLPRNNFNVIEMGHLYELFYYDRGWISMGQISAENQYLKYKSAPSTALFLLKSRTDGKEERIFTYDNGKQNWW